MTPGYWIVFRNGSGCELSRVFVKAKPPTSHHDIKAAVLAMVHDTDFEDGDSITIEAGESERE